MSDPVLTDDREVPSPADAPPEPVRPVPPRRMVHVDVGGVLIVALLAVILVWAAYLRFVGQNWDDFTHLHPDERFLTGVVSSLTPVANLGEYFDTHASGLNPNNRGAGFYVYGTLPLFVVKAASGITADLTGDPVWTGYNGAHLVGRSVSAVADMLTLFFLFLLGRRLYGRWVGLLAAALYAGAVLPVQLSHFWTTDAFTSLPVVIALWFAVRAMDEGRWLDYGGFGVALGCAVASRINVLPLAVVLALAALIRVMPTFEPGFPRAERNRQWTREFGGLVLGGLLSFIVFRLAQPYAFDGPSILGILPNPQWLAQMQEVGRQVSGQVDFAPNHQWTARTPYLFPWWNMVMWGMGLPLGLAAWISWAAAGVRILRGRLDWTRHLLPVVWVLIYFGWQGRQWVMTMRYYMPLYPALVLLAAWGLAALARAAWRALQKQKRDESIRAAFGWPQIRLALAVGLIAVVVGFTSLWALAFTNIYRHQLTRVQASYWVLENVPGDYALTIAGVDGSTRMVNLGLPNTQLADSDDRLALAENATRYFDNITLPRDSSLRDEFESGATQTPTPQDGSAGATATYRSSFAPGQQELPYQTTTPLVVRFTAPTSGTVSSVQATHLGDPNGDPDPETLWVRLWDIDEDRPLAEGTVTADFSQGESPLGDSYEIRLRETVTLVEGRRYELQTGVLEGAPVIVAGAVIATEAEWDDPVPTKVCALPSGQQWSPDLPPGLNTASTCAGIDGFGQGYYQGLIPPMHWDDVEQKRDTLLAILNTTDYITITSNRFYDSLARIPTRWPMSLRYYDALFNGELGFELVRTFTSTFALGEWTFPDQVLPTDDVPDWLNEWEAEEAFHVYDHPAVFIFRKTENYDPQVAAAIINGVELSSTSDITVWGDGTRPIGVIPWDARTASASTTALMLPAFLRQAQYSGGTWSQLFDVDAAINQNEILAVVVWWLTIAAIGWIVWPILFALFPALADRAFPAAKIAGLLLTAWIVWVAASLHISAWNRAGILCALAGLLALSLYLGWRSRADLRAYLRDHWKRLLVIEALTLALYVAFLFVRAGNPDLWHPNFSGEKPMDFAYFNAVLRSTYFPPYDPWFAGGYINYYYFGFVIVGVPVKLLGMVPSLAYNLILAMFFALTGMGTFSVAFNLVASLRRARATNGSGGALLGNPWTAGVMAMLLAVVFGNLDQIRILLEGFARAGGWSPATGQEFLPPLTAMLQGVGNVFSGQVLPISTHWWYWNPTRVIVNTGNAITEIPFFTFLYGDPHAHAIAMPVTLLVIAWLLNEVLLAGRLSIRRDGLAASLALALGALATGLLRATNTWDWLTYTLLAVFGLTLAHYLRHRAERQRVAGEDEPPVPPTPPSENVGWRAAAVFGGALFYTPLILSWQSLQRLHPTRASLLRWLGALLAFLVLSVVFALPFTQWFASAYNSAELWQGPRTPLWGYLDIHGVFLFLVISLLVWDTARYLRTVRVRDLIGWGFVVSMVLLALAQIAAIALVAALVGLGIAIIAVPVMVWAALLFFRAGQSPEMRFVWALVVLAVGLTIGVDLVVLSGDIGRQNTVFKFYLQVWLLFSIVGGAGFAWLNRAGEVWKGWLRTGWMVVATVLLTIAAMYPVLATQAKMIDRMAPDAPRTLDGMTFMQYAAQGEHGEWFALEEDYHMLRWMQENIVGSPVVLEGQSEREYLWGTRVAMFTGLPSVIGYNWHQRQQRTLDPLPRLVQQRIANVNTIYDTTDIEAAWRLLRFFDVSYIVVGQLERVYYSPAGLAKFNRMVDAGLLEVAYEYGETVVYRVRPEEQPAPDEVQLLGG